MTDSSQQPVPPAESGTPDPKQETQAQAAERSTGKGEKHKAVSLSKEEYGRLVEQARQVDYYKDQCLRALADVENAKKRLDRDREEFLKFSSERLVRNLLPVLDSFEQALKVLDDHRSTPASGGGGVRLIYRQLMELLEKEGVKRTEALGRPFDHHRHEAIQQVETTEAAEGTVIEEVQAGYTLHDRVIRPAMVKVAKRPAEQKSEDRGQKSE